MTAEDKTNLDRIFTRFGSPSREAEVRVYDFLRRAEDLDSLDSINRYDRSAAETIQKCEELIASLRSYRVSLFERYNYLTTAPSVPGVRLKRRRDWQSNKVYYDLTTFRRHIADGTEVDKATKTYPGSERRQAIKDYNAYIKSHPGIFAEQDIAKGKFER